EATGDQISALAARLAEEVAPYADMAVWGPCGRRQQKVKRYTAQVFVGGELVTRQLKGPSSFEQWRACWRVFRTAMVTLKAMTRDNAKSNAGAMSGWWYDHVDKLALMAPRPGTQAASAPQQPRAETAGGAPSAPAPGAKPKAKPKKGLAALGAQRKDGRFLWKDGQELCFTWNRTPDGCVSGPCPNKRSHSGEWCVGGHRAIDNQCK
ncbi:unnamed protein product, partial [Prorocentrum cordatum]